MPVGLALTSQSKRFLGSLKTSAQSSVQVRARKIVKCMEQAERIN